MINDKMAQMAVNTINEYCHKKQCMDCALVDTCFRIDKRFRDLRIYFSAGKFEDLQKPLEKAPKFDVALYDSPLFSNYMGLVAEEEAKKVGLNFIGGLDKVKCYPNGTIKVWYKSEMDGGTVYKGKAKCHPNDAFNPEIGIKLAVQRIAEKLNKPFVPTDGEAYFYVDDNNSVYSTVNHNANVDVLNIAVGNCFKSRERAFSNRFAIAKRIEKATKLLKKLRDERGE